MPSIVLSFLDLDRYSSFLVCLAILVVVISLKFNDYSSSFDHRFKIALEGPYAVNTDLFFEEFAHSEAFASTERINSSDFVNGSIGSADENGTKNTLRGLLTDLGDKGRWKSLLDQGLEKLQQKYPDKKIVSRVSRATN